MKRGVVSFVLVLGLILMGVGCSSAPGTTVDAGPKGPTLLDVQSAFGVSVPPGARFAELVNDSEGVRAIVESTLSVDEMEGFFGYEFESAGFVIDGDWEDEDETNYGVVRLAKYIKDGVPTTIRLRPLVDRVQVELARQKKITSSSDSSQ